MDILIILYWLGTLITLNGSDMPIVDNQLGYQQWEGGLLTYAHRENIPSLYEIEENTDILGIYQSGKTQHFKLEKIGGLIHFDGTKEINDTLFYLNGKWETTESVILYFSSPDSITIYTCYPNIGEIQGGLFVELVPIIEKEK